MTSRLIDALRDATQEEIEALVRELHRRGYMRAIGPEPEPIQAALDALQSAMPIVSTMTLLRRLAYALDMGIPTQQIIPLFKLGHQLGGPYGSKDK